MRSLLVPTDFSACANNAVRYAIELAKQGKYHLLFFHWAEQKSLDQSEEEELRSFEKNIRAQYKRIGKRPIRVSYKLASGGAFSDQLLQLARTSGSAMVIMGTKGVGNARNAFFGSNTVHVIRTSGIPVLSVPARAKFVPIKQLMYLTDLLHVTPEIRKIKALGLVLKAKPAALHFDYGWALEKNEMKAIEQLKKMKPVSFRQLKAPLNAPFTKLLKMTHLDSSSLFCIFHDNKSAFQNFLTGNNAEEVSLRSGYPLLSFQRIVS